jgi:hypothetical protein
MVDMAGRGDKCWVLWDGNAGVLEGNGRKPDIYDEECRGAPVDISFINTLGSVGSLAIPGGSVFKKVGEFFRWILGAFLMQIPKRGCQRKRRDLTSMSEELRRIDGEAEVRGEGEGGEGGGGVGGVGEEEKHED